MNRVRDISIHRKIPLDEAWQFAPVSSGLALDPTQLATLNPEWRSARVPGTVVEALQAAGAEGAHENIDYLDWWYRCAFDGPLTTRAKHVLLRLGGLATIADVWLNGAHLLHSENMFLEHELEVSDHVSQRNELLIRFQSLQRLLMQKKPRPRWRTRLVEHQELRWFRTTLLGRIPGWSPPFPPVGPWRAITLETREVLSVEQAHFDTKIVENDGILHANLKINTYGRLTPTAATLAVGEYRERLDLQEEADGSIVLSGETRVPNVELWWPHTHGAQPLYPVDIMLRFDERYVHIDCGRTGFRTITLERDPPGTFGFRVNGQSIFCRGACWTPPDIATLSGTNADYEWSLKLAQAAGMNMLRVSGTMVYERDNFYDACDELGILVWQDFMFARMDYPATDSSFMLDARREAEEVLARLQMHPCLALLCGNSEVAQQAAMLGLPQDFWTNELFDTVLPSISESLRSDVPYLSSSPSGGTLPFQASEGTTHYFGVGAYMQPLEDARRADVKFASECLGFANVPENRTIDTFVNFGELAVHHPKWKAGTPRDVGAGWDFEDVRDHYLKTVLGLDSLSLRYSDMERYLAASRVTTGEVMASVFAEWRRRKSSCRGGLVWFYRDLWLGAGWGILDSSGWPKAPYYYLKRIFAPVAIFFSDEGLNGLRIHVVNEMAAAVGARLQVVLYSRSGARLATTERSITLTPRNERDFHVDALFDDFRDLTYAYRFGPPGHDLVVAKIIDDTNQQLLGDAFYFPLGLPSQQDDVGLQAMATKERDGGYLLTLSTERFAQAVAIEAGDFLPNDNYFHMEPGGERTVRLSGTTTNNEFVGYVHPLNATRPTRILLGSNDVLKGTRHR